MPPFLIDRVTNPEGAISTTIYRKAIDTAHDTISLSLILSNPDSESIEPNRVEGFCAGLLPWSNSGRNDTGYKTPRFAERSNQTAGTACHGVESQINGSSFGSGCYWLTVASALDNDYESEGLTCRPGSDRRNTNVDCPQKPATYCLGALTGVDMGTICSRSGNMALERFLRCLLSD